jgi:hypothetical protein
MIFNKGTLYIRTIITHQDYYWSPGFGKAGGHSGRVQKPSVVDPYPHPISSSPTNLELETIWGSIESAFYDSSVVFYAYL